MHDLRVVALNKVRLVATSAVQSLQICVTGASLCGWTRNLVAVEVKNGKDCTVSHRVEEVDGLPTAFKRTGLGFAVTDDAGDNQVGIVESGAECMDQRVAKLAALMHGVRDVRSTMARDPARRRELAEHKSQAVFVWRNLRVDFSIRALKIRTGIQRRATVSRTRNVNDVRIVFFDEAIQMNVDEVLTRRSSPVAKQPRLDLFRLEWFAKQGVCEQVDLPDAKIIRRAPPAKRWQAV